MTSSYFLFVWMEAVDLTLDSATLLELLFFFWINFPIDSLGVWGYAVTSSANRESFTSYFIAPLAFSHLMALDNALNTILNNRGERAHPSPVSDVGEKPGVGFSP